MENPMRTHESRTNRALVKAMIVLCIECSEYFFFAIRMSKYFFLETNIYPNI